MSVTSTHFVFAALVHAGLLEESKGRFLAERANLLAGKFVGNNFDECLSDLRSTVRDDLPDSPYKKRQKEKDASTGNG